MVIWVLFDWQWIVRSAKIHHWFNGEWTKMLHDQHYFIFPCFQTSQTVKSDAGSEPDAQAPVNLEGQQYVDSKSYIMFEICLSQPLIPKRPAEELARRVAEYIPPRPLFPKRTDGAQRVMIFYSVTS